MEPERDEVYERIPWETLQQKGGDRQWLVYAVAGAVVLGALAYSFTRNQPVAPTAPVADSPVASTAPATTASTVGAETAPSTVASPVVVSEADLYAVDPERLIDQAAAHAEWFAVEYIAYDGTEESLKVLAGLLPSGVPLPEAPEGTQVFVDWARATTVTQITPLSFEVDVLVRSLLGQDGSAFVRQAPVLLTVSVELSDDGLPRVVQPPIASAAGGAESVDMALGAVPDDIAESLSVEGEVVGGRQTPNGMWHVVVMATGTDGVKRPITVTP